MLRLLHTSDTHLGHQQYPRVGPDGLNQRESDIYAAWDRIIETAITEKPDLFIHAGDLFDGVRPGNRALAHAVGGFHRLANAGIPVVVIAGNHEHPKLRETGSPFRLFDHLGIHAVYKGQAQTITLDAGGQKVRVHAVPQCADTETLASQVAALPTRRQAGPGALDILVVHGAVTGLPAFAHAEFNELQLDPSWFANFDYVALGHFHGAKQVAPNAWYCGAPERVSVAEAKEDKGFLDVRLSPGSPPQATFRALPARPYADLPAIDAAGLDAAQVRHAAADALKRVPDGAVARLRVTGLPTSLRGTLSPREIERLCPQAMHCQAEFTWADDANAVRGAAEIGAIPHEFESFAARQPLEGIDRAALLARAKSLLQEALP